MNKFFSICAAAIVGLASYHPAASKPVEIPSKTERWIVKDDGGGMVTSFQESLRYMSKNKMALQVSGYCASACTLLLSTDYKLDVCITPDVKFGFHQPFAMDGLGRVHYTIPFIVATERLWREEFYSKYPDFVKKMIDANGGVPAVYKGHTPQSVLWLNYEQLKPFMRTCL